MLAFNDDGNGPEESVSWNIRKTGGPPGPVQSLNLAVNTNPKAVARGVLAGLGGVAVGAVGGALGVAASLGAGAGGIVASIAGWQIGALSTGGLIAGTSAGAAGVGAISAFISQHSSLVKGAIITATWSPPEVVEAGEGVTDPKAAANSYAVNFSTSGAGGGEEYTTSATTAVLNVVGGGSSTVTVTCTITPISDQFGRGESVTESEVVELATFSPQQVFPPNVVPEGKATEQFGSITASWTEPETDATHGAATSYGVVVYGPSELNPVVGVQNTLLRDAETDQTTFSFSRDQVGKYTINVLAKNDAGNADAALDIIHFSDTLDETRITCAELNEIADEEAVEVVGGCQPSDYYEPKVIERDDYIVYNRVVYKSKKYITVVPGGNVDTTFIANPEDFIDTGRVIEP